MTSKNSYVPRHGRYRTSTPTSTSGFPSKWLSSLFQPRHPSRLSTEDFALSPMLTDALLVILSALVTGHWVLRVPIFAWSGRSLLSVLDVTAAGATASLFIFAAAVTCTACHLGLYARERCRGAWMEQKLSLHSCIVGAVVLYAALYLLGAPRGAGAAIALVAGTSAIFLGVKRAGTRYILMRLFQTGRYKKRIVIVGENCIGRSIRLQLLESTGLGYEFSGFLQVLDEPDNASCPSDDRVGTIHDIAEVARACFIDEVIITQCGNDQQVQQAILAAQRCDLDLRILPGIYHPIALHGPLCYLGDVPLIFLHRRRSLRTPLRLKRAFDILFAVTSIIAWLPIMSVVAIALAMENKGGVLSVDDCIGKRDRTFRRYKFRAPCWDQIGSSSWKRSNADDYLNCWASRFVSRYGLSSLPQLFNVLFGDMSIVGPRVLTVRERVVQEVGYVPFDVAPGITGAWRLPQRDNAERSDRARQSSPLPATRVRD